MCLKQLPQVHTGKDRNRGDDNINDRTIKHDWSWHPLKSEIQYRINGEPLAFDLKAKYDYQDEQLKLSLEDWQVTRSLKFRLTTSYTFSDDDFEIQGLFYAAF